MIALDTHKNKKKNKKLKEEHIGDGSLYTK